MNKTTKRDRKERIEQKTEKKERIKQKRQKEKKKSASIKMHFFPLYLNDLEATFCNLKSKKENIKKDLKNKYTRGRLM